MKQHSPRPRTIHDSRHQALIKMLTDARVAAGISQDEVAKALGLKQPDISKIENNERRVDLVEFLDILNFLATRTRNKKLIPEVVHRLLEETK